MTRSNKFALRMVAGGLFGALIGPGLAHLVMYFDMPIGRITLSPGGVVLAAVGGLYGLIGLFVAVGMIWPALGVLILNVADAEDLRDRREMLLVSAVTCLVLGLAMLLLPFTGVGKPIAGQTALATFAAAAVVLVVSAWMAVKQRHYDELWSRLTAEASVLTLVLLTALMMVWGLWAHLGGAALADPLLVIAAPPGLFMLACFIAAGRRGMLQAE